MLGLFCPWAQHFCGLSSRVIWSLNTLWDPPKLILSLRRNWLHQPTQRTKPGAPWSSLYRNHLDWIWTNLLPWFAPPPHATSFSTQSPRSPMTIMKDFDSFFLPKKIQNRTDFLPPQNHLHPPVFKGGLRDLLSSKWCPTTWSHLQNPCSYCGEEMMVV